MQKIINIHFKQSLAVCSLKYQLISRMSEFVVDVLLSYSLSNSYISFILAKQCDGNNMPGGIGAEKSISKSGLSMMVLLRCPNETKSEREPVPQKVFYCLDGIWGEEEIPDCLGSISEIEPICKKGKIRRKCKGMKLDSCSLSKFLIFYINLIYRSNVKIWKVTSRNIFVRRKNL